MRSSIAAVSLLGLLLTSTAFAQQTATPEQQAILRQFGINSNLVSGNVIQQLTGGCQQNPYPILEQFKAGANVHVTPQADSSGSTFQAGINSVLACRLSQFLVYAQQTNGCKFTIASAYRSAQEQANICGNGGPNCGAPGRSCHQYGLAVDLNGSASCMQWAKQFLGSKNPSSPGAQQFKLHWPITTDDGHTQCIENTVGNCTPQTQACDGTGNNINPNLSYNPQTSQQRMFNSLGSLGSLLAPPQPQMCPAGSMMLNGSCISQQAYNATQQTTNPFSYTSPSPSPSPVSNSLGSGSTNTNSNTNSNSNTSNNSVGNGTNISDILGTGANNTSNSGTGSSTSAIDLINQIANPTTTDDQTVTPATGTPVSLVSGLHNTVALHGTSTSLNPSWQSSSTYSLSPAAPQTFVSQDLSQTPTGLHQLQPTNSTFAILENIKQTLLAIITYLKPFGGVVPRATASISNSTTAYLE